MGRNALAVALVGDVGDEGCCDGESFCFEASDLVMLDAV